MSTNLLTTPEVLPKLIKAYTYLERAGYLGSFQILRAFVVGRYSDDQINEATGPAVKEVDDGLAFQQSMHHTLRPADAAMMNIRSAARIVRRSEEGKRDFVELLEQLELDEVVREYFGAAAVDEEKVEFEVVIKIESD